MNQYGKEPLSGRIKKSFFFHLILVGLAGALVYGFVNVVRQAFSLSRESQSVDEKIRALAQKKEGLEVKIKELETREAIERNAKENLGLKKMGEEVVVVVPEKKNIENALSPAPRVGIWQRITRFLFSL